MKLVPVLYVEEIDPVLPFWIDRLGFSKTAEVLEGDRLGFAILTRGDTQVMYQTKESVRVDVPELAYTRRGAAFVSIIVEDLDEVVDALQGIPPVVPRRTTFYGADELIMREPGGNVVTFARFAEAAA